MSSEQANPGESIGDQRIDHEISLDDILREDAELDSGDCGKRNDIVDAKKDGPPPLPQKIGHGTNSSLVGSKGGLTLENLQISPDDREISLHDLQEDGSTSHSISASVKAFFESGGDSVDASNEELPSFSYDMNHKKRGCFIIFNHMNFKKNLGMNSRNGTHRDKRNLERVARNLGFEYVRSFDDLTHSQIQDVVYKVAMSNHTDYDCFAMAILTHGEEGDMLYAYDCTFHVDELTEPFMAHNCKSLAGKPKLFFIQACRGSQLDDGIGIAVTPIANKTEKEILVIPSAADFLLAFSTVPGYYAWRNQSEGSWFIQALCKCLSEFGEKLELMQIMTRVNRMVAYDFISYSKQNLRFHGKKQIPSIVTRLTSEVFFKNKKHNMLPLPSERRRTGALEVDSNTASDHEEAMEALKETNL